MTDPAATTPTASKSAAADFAASRTVRRVIQQAPLILLCAVVAAVAAYLVSSSRTKQYQATTTIQLTDVNLASVVTGQSLQQQQNDVQAKAATTAQLVTLPTIRDATARALGGRVTVDDLKGAITVTPMTGTTLVVIAARNPNPQLATQIANATRDAFIADRQRAAVSQYDQASSQVSAQLAQIPAAERHGGDAIQLRDRLQQIATLRSVSSGGVEVAQRATVPTGTVAPRPKRDAILGLIAGLLLGAGIAVLRAQFDDRVRSTEELSDLWALPVVGLVPETDGLRNSGVTLPDGPALEALSLARTNLRYLHVGGDVKTLLLTSALEGEGKSTITWNLGLATALAQSRVLVIEADLRRPVISSRLDIHAKSGLSEILAGLADLDSSLTPVVLNDANRHVTVTVDVLPAGLAPPSPVALLERPAMAEMLDELRTRYDIILIDTPPATIVADAMAFMDHVDGVLIVSRLGRLRRGSLTRLRALLEGIDAPVLGQIVNSGASSKAYGYTAYTKAAPTRAPEATVEQSAVASAKSASGSTDHPETNGSASDHDDAERRLSEKSLR